jgi:hypothetical protein
MSKWEIELDAWLNKVEQVLEEWGVLHEQVQEPTS